MMAGKPFLHGLSMLVDSFLESFERKKKALAFSSKWIDLKYREGDRITAKDYQEYLSELWKIENGEI